MRIQSNQLKLRFAGVAPIPKGSQVRILVDNPRKPTRALQVEDTDHATTYTSASGTEVGLLEEPSPFLTAEIVMATVFVDGGTDLVVRNFILEK